jgi:hypothetical protein
MSINFATLSLWRGEKKFMGKSFCLVEKKFVAKFL